MKRPTPPSADPGEPAVVAEVTTPEMDQSADPTDWQKRVRDAQAALTRKSMEFAEYRRTHPDVEPDEGDEGELDDEDDDIEQAPPVSRFRPRIPEAAHDSEAAELGRSIASAVHGPDALAAYDKAMAMLSAATTEADRLTAFETYSALRSTAAASAPRRPEPPAERLLARDQAVTPTVQTNRPDTADYSSEPDPKRFEGGANGGVGGYFRELFASRRGGSR